MIYLDNAATSFPKSESVYQEMDRVNRTLGVNSGRGSYKAAREANDMIFATRNRLLDLFHAEGIADVVLTPSVTHAVNQVLYGMTFTEESIVYVTPYEHNAVARSIELLRKKLGFIVKLIPLKNDITIDLEKTEYEFSINPPTLVIMNAISNVTGYILPIQQLGDLAKQYGGLVMIDAAQAAGLIDIDMGKLNADIICFAGHKSLGGPFGIGGFLIKNGIRLEHVLAGGTGSDSLNLSMPSDSPARYEASSPNIIAIAGLLAALKELNIQEHQDKVFELTQYLISKLKSNIRIRILGETMGEIGIVSFVIQGYLSNDIGDIMDNEFDIAVRTGYHCCPYIHQYLKDKEYGGTVRVSLGYNSSKKDIDALCDALKTM